MSFKSKVINSYKNIHIQSLFGNGVMGIVGLATMAILYRALSVSEIGIYVFFMTIIGLVDTLKGGFLTNAFIKFHSGAEINRAKEISGSAWFLALLITVVIIFLNIILIIFFPASANPVINLFLKYFSLIFLSSLPSFMANLVVQSEKRFDRLLLLRLISQFLFTICILILFFINKASLNTVILSYIVSNTIGSIFTLLCSWTRVNCIKYTTRRTVVEIFNFGKYSMGTSLSSNLFKVTDVFFINYFLGPAALAIYNLGGRLNQIIEMPILSLSASGMPILSSYYNKNQKKEMMYAMKKMIGVLSISIFAVALFSVIFANPIIGLVGGVKYINTPAPNLFRIFISIAILYPADRFFALTLDVIHKPEINFYKILAMLAINLISDYIAVTMFKSIYAIVITNIFPILLAIIISYIHLNKFHKFKIIDTYLIGFKEISNYLQSCLLTIRKLYI